MQFTAPDLYNIVMLTSSVTWYGEYIAVTSMSQSIVHV